jgi:FPC/CPF motif-containing protein YcgG
MRMFQFITVASGFGDTGKKEKMNAKIKNATEATFRSSPQRPRLKWLGSKGAPVHRRQIMQPIEQM